MSEPERQKRGQAKTGSGSLPFARKGRSRRPGRAEPAWRIPPHAFRAASFGPRPAESLAAVPPYVAGRAEPAWRFPPHASGRVVRSSPGGIAFGGSAHVAASFGSLRSNCVRRSCPWRLRVAWHVRQSSGTERRDRHCAGGRSARSAALRPETSRPQAAMPCAQAPPGQTPAGKCRAPMEMPCAQAGKPCAQAGLPRVPPRRPCAEALPHPDRNAVHPDRKPESLARKPARLADGPECVARRPDLPCAQASRVQARHFLLRAQAGTARAQA